MDHVAFLGFGEAGTAFLSGWGAGRPGLVTAYDIKTETSGTRAAMEARYQEHGIAARDGIAALAGAEAVLSVVTADQALVAAEAAAKVLSPGALYLDCNSCAPQVKAAASEVIGAAGATYVDVAVMAPVHPKKHKVPLLVSGPAAERGAAALRALDMEPEVVGDAVGQASSVKMLRSVMIKGLEALMAECFLSARRAGVSDLVLASLEGSDPDIEWRRRGAYALDRMMVHGARRAAEMRDVAKTVEGLGLPPLMASATAEWQERVAATGTDPGEAELESRADRLNARL